VDVCVDIDAIDLKAAGVVVEEVDEGAGIEVVIERGGGVDANAEGRDVGADADAGKGWLMPDRGPGNAFALRVGGEAGAVDETGGLGRFRQQVVLRGE
jgi:hypothetical protein